MAEWKNPKTDWVTNPKNPVAEDFNRIEGNIAFLKQDIEQKKGAIVDALNTVGLETSMADTHAQIAGKILAANQGATNITISEFATTIPAGYYNGSGKVVMPLVAGDGIELYRSGSFQVDKSISEYNWTKVCELTMHAAGSVRISFDLGGALHDTGYYYKGPGYGRIYKNGSPAGIERVVYSDKTTRFTEDFNVQNDDKVQLYLRIYSGTTYVRAGDLTVSIQIPFDKTSVVERTY